MKQTARLRNWVHCTSYLVGDVSGHPLFQDGDRIVTSRLIDFRPDLGIAETLNTVYILRDTEDKGDVIRDYEVAA